MAKHKSILEELNQISIDRSKNYVVENRAEHLIHGAINLLEQIDDNYSPDDAKNLGNRLINSIKHRDPSKFSRGIKKIIKENQKESNIENI